MLCQTAGAGWTVSIERVTLAQWWRKSSVFYSASWKGHAGPPHCTVWVAVVVEVGSVYASLTVSVRDGSVSVCVTVKVDDGIVIVSVALSVTAGSVNIALSLLTLSL